MTQSNFDTNVAILLRDIAANSDEVTGKILRKADKAAKKGKSFIKIKVTFEDYNFIRQSLRLPGGYIRQVDMPAVTPLIEKLYSLGFKLTKPEEENSFWSNGMTYYLRLEW